MRYLWLLLVAGCVTAATTRLHNVERLNSLAPGMSREEALQLMGTKPGRTAQFGDPIPNPYKSESYEAKGQRVTVLYYYTSMAKQDGGITDDELTPLVFVNERLEGWGWGYWRDQISKYEIRVR